MSKMRAAVVPAAHSRFRMEERDLPEPGRHEVRILVRACGVCHSDVVTVEGMMPGLTYPRIPGHEVIGEIDALGPDVEGWAVGDRVGVGWFGGSCGYCQRCRRSEAFACENIHGATGVTRDGGYATHMLALASALAKVPAELDPVQSAPLLCAGITTFNALRHCGAAPGDLVAIHGVGGLGPNGTMMVIGAVGNLTVNSLDMLNKRAAVRGWYSGTAPDSEDTLEFSQLNAITSMNEIFPLAQAQAAYDHMMSGKARFRVVLQMD
jgi:D-arabinose 1-dehydrogenase-like Zn-dependent alcohol dehydrogenase